MLRNYLRIKIALCGEGGVGKTSLAIVFTEGKFREPKLTVGIFHFTKVINYSGREVRVVLWDLGGEHRFRFLAPVFLRGAKGVVYVFDVTRPATLAKLRDWIEIVEKTIGRVPSVIVGNKIDLKDRYLIDSEVVRKFAETYGFQYFETSAKLNINVEKPFLYLLKELVENI